MVGRAPEKKADSVAIRMGMVSKRGSGQDHYFQGCPRAKSEQNLFGCEGEERDKNSLIISLPLCSSLLFWPPGPSIHCVSILRGLLVS